LSSYTSRNRQRAYTAYKKLRQACLEILGGKCAKCGFDDPRALQVDHSQGGGTEERARVNKNGKKYLQGVVTYRNVVGGKHGYQLLCANCNWIKKAEMGEHRNYKNALRRVDTQERLSWLN
jgi:hypothetical protein